MAEEFAKFLVVGAAGAIGGGAATYILTRPMAPAGHEGLAKRVTANVTREEMSHALEGPFLMDSRLVDGCPTSLWIFTLNNDIEALVAIGGPHADGAYGIEIVRVTGWPLTVAFNGETWNFPRVTAYSVSTYGYVELRVTP
ncbi:MAG: hypothetical protein Q8J76_14940 [Desulfobulbaceae bacterium]|nr:hypothetical protein [Desulfobulbaceae bacterium]